VLSAFVGRKDLRWPLPENLAERLTGRQFTRLARRGKYVMMMLDNGRGAFASSWHVRLDTHP
jgi:formamidopyrimidine-DNA glycosylase